MYTTILKLGSLVFEAKGKTVAETLADISKQVTRGTVKMKGHITVKKGTKVFEKSYYPLAMRRLLHIPLLHRIFEKRVNMAFGLNLEKQIKVNG